MPLPPRNLLGTESSPYLRQHKDNPVHWRPWSATSLKEAAELDRPILLSIGYAACHWCHVMAHESFESEAVAAVMNRLFVNIKVDREERPDIDQIYMAALNATGEQGGWPLTIFLTPQAKPFWGGTYFPPEPRYGRAGFVQVLEAIHKAWSEKRNDIDESAAKLSLFVTGQLARPSVKAQYSREMLPRFVASIVPLIDPKNGGLKGAPKFPNAPMMTTLWLNWLASGDETSRDAVLRSLVPMLEGGIYDHVGGGLCRYSTDADWLVPHFEKMLYDNAQLIRLCGWTFAENGQGLFRERIESCIDWLTREMRMPGGAFAASLDADSDGEEGLFYTWTGEEIRRVLKEDASAFFSAYKLTASEGWHGNPILSRDADFADESIDLQPLLAKLRLAREKRIRPTRDDKILVDWNGLAIRALAEAARQFGRDDWLSSATEAHRFIIESKDAEGRLPHSILGSKRLYPAMASDYAAMINASISLFEATQRNTYIEEAWHLLEQLDRWYGDETRSGHYLTASDSRDVPMRTRADIDDAVPSATAQTIEAVARLANVSGDAELATRCAALVEEALGRVAGQAYGQAGMVNAASIAADPHKLLVVESDAASLVSVANRYPDPRRVDIIVPVGSGSATAFPGGILPDTSMTSAWLCRGSVCLAPIHDARYLANALNEKPPMSANPGD